MQRRLILYSSIALLLFAFAARTAFAHATLVRAEPRPDDVLNTAPRQVTLWFDEPVEPAFAYLIVHDSGRARVSMDDLRVSPDDARMVLLSLKPLRAGTYTVAWQVISQVDGHLTEGTYSFSVGSVSKTVVASDPPRVSESDPIFVATRGLGYLALFTLFGAILFREFFLVPSLRAIRADERLGNADWQRLVVLSFGLLIATEAIRLVLQTKVAAGSINAEDLWLVLTQSRFGYMWIARQLLLTLSGIALLLSTRPRTGRPWMPALALALGGYVLLTAALTGHSASAGDFTVAVAVDWLHLVAASAWVGGLVTFVWVIPPLWRALPRHQHGPWLVGLSVRFFRLTVLAVGILVLTGLYNTREQVPSLAALFQTGYGRLVASKASLFGLILCYGAINAFILRPHLEREDGADGFLLRLYRLLATGQAAILVLILVLASILTLSLPARSLMSTVGLPSPLPTSAIDTSSGSSSLDPHALMR